MTFKKWTKLAGIALSAFLILCIACPQSIQAANASGPVALDAGHGGADSGALGHGLVEKTLNWKITNYCKERLESKGISTVMVRTSENENPSIYDRCSRANNAGARCLVSFHVNSGAASANGAELLVGNESAYNYWTTQEGKKLASSLLPSLAYAGLANRGILQRDYGGGTSESYYPDGSMADYYGIVRYARRFNMTGNIIEHGFITNDHDAMYLGNEEYLRLMGYLDADYIAATWPQTSVGRWVKDSKGWWYRKADGTYPVNCWYLVGTTWYAFNEAGYMRYGWFNDNGTWYYLGGADDGAMRSGGWFLIDNAWYWLQGNGAMLANQWINVNSTWYWLTGSGAMATGWANVNGTWFYLDPSSGAMRSGGWFLIDNAWYWLQGNGAMLANQWINVNSTWYWLTGSGAMATGWLNLSGTWYFLAANGAMYAGPGYFNINGTNYYIYANGVVVIARNSWTNAAGNPSEQKKPSTKIYYYDADGKLAWTRTTNTPVMSSSAMSKDAFVASFSKRIAANYPAIYKTNPGYGAQTAQAFAEATWDAANSEGVRPELLAAQIADETGWLKFGGAVPASACNFGGIGAVDHSPQSYAIFPNIQTGLLAQAQHLKAYSSTDPLNKPCVDPRFNLVTRGIAPYIEDYGWGMWASNPTYNIDLLRIMNTILGG